MQLLVKPKVSMSEAALHAIIKAAGGREHGTIQALDVRVIRVPAVAAEKLMAALRRNQDVAYVEPDSVATAAGSANDPFFAAGNQWALARTEVTAAWDTTVGSGELMVAVLDSGVLATHPDLNGRVMPGHDFINQDADATDDHGHGTAVAGIIAAATNNRTGMAGISWNSAVLPVKVLGANGSGTYSAMAQGIIWAADRGARIINMSLGGTASSITLQSAVDYAWNRNAIIVAAAGNNGDNARLYPAACNHVVAVSATDASDVRPEWSNFGPYVDVSAPGVNVLTLQGASSYAYWNGTSFSCPVTAGVVSLMVSANPGLTNAAVVEALLDHSDDIGATGYDVYYGHGRVNARRAVAAVKVSAPADATPPSLVIVSPEDGVTLADTVNVGLSATDDFGVTKLELYIGGVLYGESDAESALLSWDTQMYLDGDYVLEARAYDAANNVAVKRVTVTVKNSPAVDVVSPLVSITSPKEGAKLKGKSVKVEVTSSDNVGVKRVELFANGKLLAESTEVTTTFVWDISKLPTGNHVLQAFAFDAAGNIGSSFVVKLRK